MIICAKEYGQGTGMGQGVTKRAMVVVDKGWWTNFLREIGQEYKDMLTKER